MPVLLKIASWNVNSLRARIESLKSWIKKQKPDVLCLQETKCRDEHIPFEEFTDLGYELAHFGVNQWNGVGILSRCGISEVKTNFTKPRPPFDEPRFIRATCGGMEILNVYVPNGRELEDPHYYYKLDWLKKLHSYLKTEGLARRPSLILGDFNVAPADFDVYNPIRWKNRTHTSPPERAAVARLYKLGYIDTARHLNPESPEYTWWNYRAGSFGKNLGLRIDLILASPEMKGRLKKCWVDRKVRAGQRPSDHAPVILELSPGISEDQ